MEWFWSKVDVLIAAIFVAATSIAASQSYAFISQYESRLAGELAQARARVEEIGTGLRYKLMSDVVRADLEATAKTRFDQLRTTHDAVANAGPILKPLAFARHREPALLDDTIRNFTPRLPQGPGAVFFAALGALVGFAVYELVKLPVVLIARPRQRRFRRRG